MNIKYGNSDSGYGRHSLILAWLGWGVSEGHRIADEQEVERQYGPKHNREGPPRLPPFSRYTVIGLIVGMIVGGIVGYFTGLFFTLILVGFAAGAIFGTEIGVLVRKRLKSRSKGTEGPPDV